jgi:hypothetical protein
MSAPVDFVGFVLDLAQSKEAVVSLLQQTALTAIDNQAARFEDQLASLGHVKAIYLAKDKTTLAPLDLVFKVTVEPVSGMSLPFLVHLPSFKVESDGDITKDMIGSAIGLLTSAMGNLNLSDNGIENLKPVIDNELKRYGVSFDAGVNLADIIAVKLREVVIDRHGLSLPDSFAVGFDEYIPIPPYLAIGKLGGTVWVHPAGKFGVAATLVLSIDPEGWIIQVVAGFTGNGPERTIEVNGNLLIFTIPLFHAKGFADFGNEVLTMDAETLSPLSAILAMKTKSKLDAKAKIITATSDVDLLGLKTTGALAIHLSGDKLVVVTGSANWNTLGVGANLVVRTTTEFHNPTAEGNTHLGFIGADAGFSVDLAHVKLGFKWLGIGLAVVAPSVNRIDQRLIEDLIKSLFDFKFSLDQLKNITVNLVDKNGKQTDSYGEGDAPGGDGAEGKGSKEEPTKVTGGGNGTITEVEPASDSCSSNRNPNRIWAKEPQLKGDYIEGIKPPGQNTVFISNNAQIISEAVKQILSSSVILACLSRQNSPHKAFNFRFTDGKTADIINRQVAVVLPRTGPRQLLALEFAKGSTAIVIALPTGAEEAIFGAGGLAGASTWTPTRFGRGLLKKIVLTQLEGAAKITAIHAIPQTSMIPRWDSKPVSIIELTKAGQEFVQLASDISDTDTVELSKGSPLFAPLKADPTGTFAQLTASVQPLHSLSDDPPPLTLRSTGDPACQIALADATDTHYAVAFEGAKWSVARFTDSASRSQAGTNWLDPYCSQLLSFGSRADVRIAREIAVENGEQTVLAGRSTDADAQAPIWWLSTAVRSAPDVASAALKLPSILRTTCVSEAGMKLKFPTNSQAIRRPPINRQGEGASILNWGDDLGARVHMLAALTGDWQDDFLLNPRGIFLAPDGLQACPTHPAK